MHELSKYADFDKLLKDNNYANEKFLKVKKIDNLYLIKYDKKHLHYDNIDTLGLFRSIICDEKKIVSFSPPKSRNLLDIQNINDYNKDDYIFEEFVEGTMINVFWNENISDWDLATRSYIGGKCCFNINNKPTATFRYMFLDAMNSTKLNFSDLNKNYSYSFVLQHPENQIVVPFNMKTITLVSVFSFDNFTVKIELNEFDRIITQLDKFGVFCPRHFNLLFPEVKTFNHLIDLFNESNNIDYKILGCVLLHKHNGTRIKIRNKTYEYVRRLKGNTPKLQFQYYNLRKLNKVADFLKYYPEKKELLSKMRNNLHYWTTQLHKNYIDCFINKFKPLKEFPYEYKPHLYALHQLWLNELREKKEHVSKRVVINYVNSLPPQRLMYSVNYKLKQNTIEEHLLTIQNLV